MKKTILLFLFTVFIFSNSLYAQRVSAYQGGSYQPGLMNVRDLVASSTSSLIFIDYNYWNKSEGYYNRFGDKVDQLEIGNINLDLDMNISGYINVPVIYYASKFKILGGRYAVSIAPVYLTSGYKSNIHTDNNDVYTSTNSSGFGDLAFSPLNLSWAKEKMDISFIYTAYAPTGKYKTGASDNIGKGYWTHQFQAPTYFYFKKKATAFVINPTFEINGEVKNSDVKPGNRFTIEYGISQYVNSWLEFEILNGHNWQIGNDKGDDVWWRGTPLYDKDQTSTISFGAGVWPIVGKLNVRLKYALDYGTKQRYKSNFLSLSAIFIPNIQKGKKEYKSIIATYYETL